MSDQFQETGFKVGGNKTSTSGAADNTTYQNSGQQFNQQPLSSGFNALHALQSGFSMTASGNSATGNITDVLVLFKKLHDRVAKTNGNLDYSLIPIEHPSLKTGAVVVSTVFNNVLYYSVIIIEHTSAPLTNPVINIINSGPIERDISTADLWDSRMKEIVEEKIRQYNQGVNLIQASAMVVHKFVDIKNEDNLDTYFDSAILSLLSTIRSMNNQPTSPITSKVLNSPDVQLVIRYEITPNAILTGVNKMPIHADGKVTMFARPTAKSANKESLHDSGSNLKLTSAAFYIDFYRTAPTPNKNFNSGHIVPYTGYDPVIVLSEISVLEKGYVSNDTLLSTLLALPTILPIVASTPGYPQRWSTIFEPTLGDSSKKTSIGVLGLEHNPFLDKEHDKKVLPVVTGSEINGYAADSYTAGQIAQVYISDNILVALDITHGSPLEWLQFPVGKASIGSKFEKIIIAELDAFSDGWFSRNWVPKNKPIISDREVDIHAGYYIDKDNKPRDIRAIDYLAMLEYTKGDPNIFVPWARGFLPGANSLQEMDTKRRGILNVASTATITGLHRRIFFNNAFIETIDQMLNAVGINNIQVEGLQELTASNKHAYSSGNSGFFEPLGQSKNFQNNVGTGGQGGGVVDVFKNYNGLGSY